MWLSVLYSVRRSSALTRSLKSQRHPYIDCCLSLCLDDCAYAAPLTAGLWLSGEGFEETPPLAATTTQREQEEREGEEGWRWKKSLRKRRIIEPDKHSTSEEQLLVHALLSFSGAGFGEVLVRFLIPPPPVQTHIHTHTGNRDEYTKFLPPPREFEANHQIQVPGMRDSPCSLLPPAFVYPHTHARTSVCVDEGHCSFLLSWLSVIIFFYSALLH